MGDDAEYYIEQQEREARFQRACEHAALDHNGKHLLCWADGVGYDDEIWRWEPLNEILGVFSNLHRERQIGSDCFLASSVHPCEHFAQRLHKVSHRRVHLQFLEFIFHCS